MVKMHDIRRTSADVKAEKKAMGRDSEHAYVPPEDDGARFELEHHHLEKMGADGLQHGDEVEFRGKGRVERSVSGDRNSATIRFHHGGVDGEFKSGDGEERKALRSDLEKAHGAAEERASKVKNDKQIPEKGGK